MPIDYRNLLESAYGLTVKKLSSTPGGQLAECIDGKTYVLKQSRMSPEKIVCTHIATRHLHDNDFTEAQIFLPGINGLPFAPFSGSFYTLSPTYKGRECVLEDKQDLAASSRLLAKMHIAAIGFTEKLASEKLEPFITLMYEDITEGDEDNNSLPPKKLNFKCDLGKTPDVFRRRLNELRRFRKNAAKRKEQFDYAYAAIADYYCSLAEKICVGLENSAYTEISKHYEEAGCLCHREYTAHNILIGSDNQAAAVLGFDSVCIDMPVYDLANFIRRRMRKCGWSVSDAEYIVKQYDTVKAVSGEEQQILKLLLQFPQKLWRITNKYYNSRRVWCEKSCLAKLEEVKSEKEPLAAFAKDFLA